MKKIKLLIFILFASQSLIIAQNILSGKITDSFSGDLITGVNVIIPELNKGIISNVKGEYKITDIPKGKFTIRFSFIGYKSEVRIINFTKNNEILDISMEKSDFKTVAIVISGGKISTQHENAIKIDVLSAREFNNKGSFNLSEAISQVAGVDIISKGAGIGKPVIRGLSMNEILVLNNGVRYENQQWSADHPLSINEFGIEKIEIIKGPSSLLYGSDAIGGVINIIKESPALPGEINGKYNANYFSSTKGFSNNFSIKGAEKKINWGIWTGLKNHADYTDGENNYIPNSRFNEKSVKANFGINKRHYIFNLFYEYNNENLGLVVPPIYNIERGREPILWFQDLTNNVISIKNKIFINNSRLEINASYQNNLRKLSEKNISLNLNTANYSIRYTLPIKNNFDIISGVQGMNKKNINDGINHIIPNAEISNYAVFTLLQYKINKNINTQAGLRYDIHSLKTDEDGLLGSMQYKEAVNSENENISYSGGITYNINDKYFFRANVAAGFRAPNLSELTANGQHGIRYEVGNNLLKSEKNIEEDLSLHVHYKYFTFDIAIFNNQISSYIFLSPTNDTITGGYYIYEYLQSNAKLYGGEAGIHIHPHPFDWLHIRATYSNVTGIQENDNYLPYIPANKIKTEIRVEIKKIKFLEKINFSFSSNSALTQNTPSLFETNTPAYTIYNASVNFNKKLKIIDLQFGINVTNITNKVYSSHLSLLKDIGFNNAGRNINIYLCIPFVIKSQRNIL